jgi:hypothetical protein
MDYWMIGFMEGIMKKVAGVSCLSNPVSRIQSPVSGLRPPFSLSLFRAPCAILFAFNRQQTELINSRKGWQKN